MLQCNCYLLLKKIVIFNCFEYNLEVAKFFSKAKPFIMRVVLLYRKWGGTTRVLANHKIAGLRAPARRKSINLRIGNSWHT